ncbi:MAG: viral A-type inclusion protein [Cyclobacteriaceae bacterium]|nr:viral A-type inclusion protein [Cyclobacteriaceae bacterium]
MRLKSVLIVFSWIILFSCNNENKQDNNNEEMSAQEQRDVLYQEVITVHDEVMPKMEDIVLLQEKIRIQINSLNEVDSSSSRVSGLREMNALLESADNAMMNWMREFKPEMNAKEVENEVALKYLENEMDRIHEVKKVVNESISSAEEYLESKTNLK